MSAEEVVLRYLHEVWNEGRADVVREVCADPVTRHDAGEVTRLDHAAQIARVEANRAAAASSDGRNLRFDIVVTAAGERDVCVVWNMTAPADCRLADADFPKTVVGDEMHMCGSEIFRIADGRIAEVWNPPPMAGHWA